MNYLDIIADGTLILFTPPEPTKPAHHRTLSSSSSGPIVTPPTTPYSTPTTLHSLPRPGPVEISILNLMSSDTDCAYYLLTRILDHASVFHPAAVSAGGEAGVGAFASMNKDVMAEAEVMAWREVDKARMFMRSLGEWYASHPQGISEDQLRKLAAARGVGWKGNKDKSPEDRQERRDGRRRVVAVPA